MASEGPNNPTAGNDDAAVGSEQWVSPTNIYSSDNQFAQITPLAQGRTTHYCRATGFGFAIPSGATIDGVVVEVERREQSAVGVRDSSVRLYKAGWAGDDKADTGTSWPTGDTYASYGSSTDDWNAALTDTIVNASTFGAGVSAYNPGANTNIYIDHIRITIYYTEVGTMQVIAVSSVGSVI
jgi:hypothetical protein